MHPWLSSGFWCDNIQENQLFCLNLLLLPHPLAPMQEPPSNAPVAAVRSAAPTTASPTAEDAELARALEEAESLDIAMVKMGDLIL